MTKFDSIRSGSQGGLTAQSQYDLRNVAREHAQEALALIIKVLNHPKATPQARIGAARTLLERGWGESLQEMVRPHRQVALATLLSLMKDSGTSLRTRLVAANVLLDFGGGESRERVAPPTLSQSTQNTQRWLDELKEIQDQFAADRPALERPRPTHN